ncbi:aspartic proteinase 39-like isoform X2 [Cicer arietinum]|uniref:aspartic proteinase 39-like isoform X2 n=1 Tax=Cicer arietinum TaxID=3827 RepID=UPI00064163FE
MASVIVSTVCTHYLPSKRILSLNHRVDTDTLRARDKTHYSRMLNGSVDVFNFTLQGNSDPNSFWFYTTKVKLGSPPKEFTILVDTGSNSMWVNCKTYSNCPHSNALGFKLNFFDTTASSTIVLVQCLDIRCPSEFEVRKLIALLMIIIISATTHMGIKMGVKPRVFMSLMKCIFVTIHKHSSPVTVNSSATIVFGCSTKQFGGLTETGETLDGIFGFGPGVIYVLSQFSSKRISPKVFSHCLKGDSNGGGILVFGSILKPNIIYSPMISSQAFMSMVNNSQLIQMYLQPLTTKEL